MAKKILYKVKAYHCPKCGGITEPTKKYCDFCERDLQLRSKNEKRRMRLLVERGDFVYWDEVLNLNLQERYETIEVTTLEDKTIRRIMPMIPSYDFEVRLPFSERREELLRLDYTGLHKIRFEHLGVDTAFETESYIVNSEREIMGDKFPTITLKFMSAGETRLFEHAIPDDVMNVMRCPNCGAAITSRYGACDYCSGWSEVEW